MSLPKHFFKINMDFPQELKTKFGILKFKKNFNTSVALYDNYIIKFDYFDLIEKELDIIKDLDHENIPKVLEYDNYTDKLQEDNVGYLVMDYFPCNTLDEFLNSIDFISLNDAILLVEEIRDTLDYIHSKGINHDDLHNDNILICEDLSHKIIDFGEASYSKYINDEDELIILAIASKLKNKDKCEFISKYVDNPDFLIRLIEFYFGVKKLEAKIKFYKYIFTLIPYILKLDIIYTKDDIKTIKRRMSDMYSLFYDKVIETKEEIDIFSKVLDYFNWTKDDLK